MNWLVVQGIHKKGEGFTKFVRPSFQADWILQLCKLHSLSSNKTRRGAGCTLFSYIMVIS